MTFDIIPKFTLAFTLKFTPWGKAFSSLQIGLWAQKCSRSFPEEGRHAVQAMGCRAALLDRIPCPNPSSLVTMQNQAGFHQKALSYVRYLMLEIVSNKWYATWRLDDRLNVKVCGFPLLTRKSQYPQMRFLS